MDKRPETFWARRVEPGSGDHRVWPPHGAQLCVSAKDVSLRPVIKMDDWTYVEDGLPSEVSPVVVFDETPCLVTDGFRVGVCDWQRGHGMGTPWAGWSTYGDIQPGAIIAWIKYPLPALPRSITRKPSPGELAAQLYVSRRSEGEV